MRCILINFENSIYIVGLLLVIVYFLLSIDDLLWDLITLTQRKTYQKQKIDLKKLNDEPPKLLAMAIAAWHEENVLEDVVDNIIISTNYPKSMYHIFIGVYPNDEATIKISKKLSTKYINVHTIINDTPGPTSKAQNINYVISQIKKFEKDRKWAFASLTIHDSEDVVHPFELLATNYLIEKHDALQFPVFPMMRMPKFSNFFSNITTGTYADEFAENHFGTMVGRYTSKAFVPSAGTGFALSRKILESFGNEDILPKDSLTEDYSLSLNLYKKGIQMYYVLERVPRIEKNGKLKWDYITTKSIFPSTFKTAVKQKTRWILGITMQSFKFREIFQTKEMSFVGRYSLYKDLKAKIGNLLVLIGYPILIYFIVSLFTKLPTIYPKGSVSWALSVLVTIMMIERQLFRGVAIYNVYGFRSMFFACFFPPLLPIRLIWGNIINMTATIRAYKQRIFGNQPKQKKEKKDKKIGFTKKLEWAKTDHEFIEKSILTNYHRNIGDYLLQKGHIEPEVLKEALKESSSSGEKIGTYLLKKNIITEEVLLDSLSEVKQIPFLRLENIEEYELHHFSSFFKKDDLHELHIIPIMKIPNGYVIAFSEKSPQNAQSILREKYKIDIKSVFSSTKDIIKGLNIIYSQGQKKNKESLISSLQESNIINYEQAILARNYKNLTKQSEEEILVKMGLYNYEDIMKSYNQVIMKKIPNALS